VKKILVLSGQKAFDALQIKAFFADFRKKSPNSKPCKKWTM